MTCVNCNGDSRRGLLHSHRESDEEKTGHVRSKAIFVWKFNFCLRRYVGEFIVLGYRVMER